MTLSHSMREPIPHPGAVLIGHKGMLGRDLLASLERSGFLVTGLDIPEIDITRSESVLSCFKAAGPDLVINCAAYTAVDKAETDVEAAFAVNRDGSANLAEACKALGIPLIHLSTDYVFDGTAKSPYREDDPVNPLSVYGRSKWEGEEAIRSRLSEHLIVRTAWLYGVHGQNFVKTMLRLGREREEIRVVADQHGCPTWTEDLSEALVFMAKRILDPDAAPGWGTFHFCGGGATTWHAFARAIIEEGRQREALKVERVLPITTADYPTPAHRPASSVLDCHKVGAHFGITPPSWRASLSKMIEELYSLQ